MRKRARTCGTCSDPSENFCKNPSNPIQNRPETAQFCPESDQFEIEDCNDFDCLMNSNKNWRDDTTGKRKNFKVKAWRNDPKNQKNKSNAKLQEEQWIGGCVDYETDSFKSFALFSNDFKFRNKDWMANQAAFGECMRICQEDFTKKCLSITFFPSYPPVQGLTNCYLHKIKCHDQDKTRTVEYTKELKKHNPLNLRKQNSWYAFIDLCNIDKYCGSYGTFYKSTCDSSKENAYPNLPKCGCPSGPDKLSGNRLFGNAVGYRYFDLETGKILVRSQNQNVLQHPEWYKQRDFVDKNSRWSLERYENMYSTNNMACHDPCAHHRCGRHSKCIFDETQKLGYRCECESPFTVDPESNTAYNSPCIAPPAEDKRNYRSDFVDGKIFYGGGWHYNRPPGTKRSEESSPTDRYYGLEGTDDPNRVRVTQASERMPGLSTIYFKH